MSDSIQRNDPHGSLDLRTTKYDNLDPYRVPVSVIDLWVLH